MTKRARFDELIRTHGERAHRLAWRLLGGDDRGARDVVRSAFARASIDTDEASLTRIVVSETRRYRQRVTQTDDRFRTAVVRLSDDEREAFVLVHLEGHTLEETSDLLARTVQGDLHQGFERLRTDLADLGMNDRDLLETMRARFRPSIEEWERMAGGLRSDSNLWVPFLLALATVAAIFAWYRAPADAPPEMPIESVTTLQGWVTTTTGSSIAGAIVSAAGATALTDQDGAFAIPHVVPRDVQVTVRAPGLSTAEARIDPRRPVTLPLLPVTDRGSIDAATGGTVADKKGFSLVVPPDSFPGTTGPIDVEWILLRDAGSLGAAPAPLATADDPLESFGMVEVRFAQNGERVEFHGTADLTWPLAAHAPFRDGELAGLYSYDRDTGVWKAAGEGKVSKGRVHAQVTHFSWWSCDRPIVERGCIAGRFDGPLSSTIYLEGDDYLARVATAPRQDGEFCVDAMPARGARLFARSRVGDRCYVAGERVVPSRAGTSCAIDPSVCTKVRLSFTEVACPQPTPWRGERR
jgi:DNA-directed RNA polymerase specialized sigma24 family protein